MTVGEKIKELRIEKKLTQNELAKQIGVSQKAIDYWERSVNEPKSCYIISMVKFFSISYNDFFEDVE